MNITEEKAKYTLSDLYVTPSTTALSNNRSVSFLVCQRERSPNAATRNSAPTQLAAAFFWEEGRTARNKIVVWPGVWV